MWMSQFRLPEMVSESISIPRGETSPCICGNDYLSRGALAGNISALGRSSAWRISRTRYQPVGLSSLTILSALVRTTRTFLAIMTV